MQWSPRHRAEVSTRTKTCLTAYHDVVLSQFILTELKDKLTGTFAFTAREANAAIRLLESRCEVVTISPLRTPICRDPDDDSIIATALAGKCACVITGDKDLLDLDSACGIPIIPPGSFWQFEQT